MKWVCLADAASECQKPKYVSVKSIAPEDDIGLWFPQDGHKKVILLFSAGTQVAMIYIDHAISEVPHIELGLKIAKNSVGLARSYLSCKYARVYQIGLQIETKMMLAASRLMVA